MLVNFTVKNYRSFKQERTFSMEASSIKEHKESVISEGKYSLLPLAVFYGANSGGKSNFIQAISTMRSMVRRSVRLNEGDALPYDPFALDENSDSQPTLFEIQFIKGEVLYRYGFEYNKTDIISEWLYEKRFGEKEYELFVRSRDIIEVSAKRFLEGQGKELGFTRFSVKKVDIPKEALESAPKTIRSQLEKDIATGSFVEPITTHNVYDENGLVIGERNFHKNKMESEGTKKVIEISGPIFDTLNEGKTLIVDELDAKLHPLLTRNIVLLFMDPEKNKHGAQLIFATHDTNLLDLDIVRRDQIWFAEKDKVESTDIYSLVEFKDEDGKKVRNDRDIKRDYIRGRYGAIPFIGK